MTRTLNMFRSAAVCCVLLSPVFAFAQQPSPSPTPTHSLPPLREAFSSRIWIVAGGGFAVARAGCADCDLEGIYHKSYSFLVDAGLAVTPRVDAGVELFYVSLKVNGEDAVRTSFILGVVQMRPWAEHGLFLKAGMGIGIAGNGLSNPGFPELAPPYTTNALGIVYGIGWELKVNKRWALQVQAQHHVAALGELHTVAGDVIRNVVGNYWSVGGAIVIR